MRDFDKYVNTGPAAWRGIRAPEFHDTDVGALRRRLKGRRVWAKMAAGATAIILFCSFLFACAIAVGR